VFCKDGKDMCGTSLPHDQSVDDMINEVILSYAVKRSTAKGDLSANDDTKTQVRIRRGTSEVPAMPKKTSTRTPTTSNVSVVDAYDEIEELAMEIESKDDIVDRRRSSKRIRTAAKHARRSGKGKDNETNVHRSPALRTSLQPFEKVVVSLLHRIIRDIE